MLVWVDEAGGNGGFHLGDVIVIGKRDLDDIAQRMWEESVRPTSAVTMHQRCFGHSLAEMRAAAELFLKAHEIGHAYAPCFVQSVACESNADRVAGRIAHSLGWSEHLGRLFMYVIGCHTPQCTTHPNRLERVRHLLHGLEEQRLADASASRQQYRAHAPRFAGAM